MKSHKTKVDDMLKDPYLRGLYTKLNKSTRSWFEHQLLPTINCSDAVKEQIIEELNMNYLDVFTPLVILQEQLNYASEWAGQRETVVYENKRIKRGDFLIHIKKQYILLTGSTFKRCTYKTNKKRMRR